MNFITQSFYMCYLRISNEIIIVIPHQASWKVVPLLAFRAPDVQRRREILQSRDLGLSDHSCRYVSGSRASSASCTRAFVALLHLEVSIDTLQGSAKRLRPGLVNKRRKNSVLLPAAGRRTQFFLLIFTKPGRSLLAKPCTYCCLNLPAIFPKAAT